MSSPFDFNGSLWASWWLPFVNSAASATVAHKTTIDFSYLRRAENCSGNLPNPAKCFIVCPMATSPNFPTRLAEACVGRELVRMVEKELGADPRTIFSSSALAAVSRAQPGDQIAAKMLIELFDRAAKALNRPDLGIAFVEWANIRDLGNLALLWDNYSTLSEVLAAAAKYQPLENSALTFRLERNGSEARMVHTLAPDLTHGAEQLMEAVMGFSVKVIRTLFNPAWHLIGVEMIHPLLSSRQRMYEYFKAPVLHNGSEYAITFPAADLRMRRDAGDPALRRLIEQFLDDRVSHCPVDLTDEVKRTISWLLRFGSATLEETADLLAMSSRTLQRKLQRTGTDFATLLTEVRTDITLAYFAKDADRPIGQLTSLLGYSEPSAVSRFLKQRFGHDSRFLRQMFSSAEKNL